MIIYCQNNLLEIKKVLQLLNDQQYLHKSILLSNSSIGQHTRHIIEFYQSVITGGIIEKLNYDNRERNELIETDRIYAITLLDKLILRLSEEFQDYPIILEGNFSVFENNQIQIQTTFLRELAYAFEHSIHHQALIKIGLLEIEKFSLVDESFGVAPATIRFRNSQY